MPRLWRKRELHLYFIVIGKLTVTVDIPKWCDAENFMTTYTKCRENYRLGGRIPTHYCNGPPPTSTAFHPQGQTPSAAGYLGSSRASGSMQPASHAGSTQLASQFASMQLQLEGEQSYPPPDPYSAGVPFRAPAQSATRFIRRLRAAGSLQLARLRRRTPPLPVHSPRRDRQLSRTACHQ